MKAIESIKATVLLLQQKSVAVSKLLDLMEASEQQLTDSMSEFISRHLTEIKSVGKIETDSAFHDLDEAVNGEAFRFVQNYCSQLLGEAINQLAVLPDSEFTSITVEIWSLILADFTNAINQSLQLLE